MKKIRKDTKFKFNSDSKLSKIENMKLVKLLNEYYSEDITVKKVISKYELDFEARDFSKNLPYIESNVECPYDNTKMYIKLPSKSGASFWQNDFVCFECGHEEFDKRYHHMKCECDNCKNKREKIINQKRDIIISRIDSIPINYYDMEFDLRFKLAIVLQALNAKSLTDIGPLVIHNFDKNVYDDIVANLKELFHHGIIDISMYSDMGAFCDFDFENKTFRFYMEQVKWDIYIDYPSLEEDELLELLKHPTPEILDKKLINKYYKQTVVNELENIYINVLNEFKFVYKRGSDRTKLEETFIRLLNIYCPAQIYSLIWAAVRRADNLRTTHKMGNYKFRQSAFVLHCIENRIQSLTEKGKEVELYNYPKNNCNILIPTKIFFGEIHPKIDWFTKLVPSESFDNNDSEIKMQYLIAHEQMLDREKEEINLIEDILKNAQNYRITKYGLIVNDGNLDILYSDEISCYKYGKDFGENIDFTSENWIFDLKSNIYIDGYYSTYFVLMLLKNLESSNVLRIEE